MQIFAHWSSADVATPLATLRHVFCLLGSQKKLNNTVEEQASHDTHDGLLFTGSKLYLGVCIGLWRTNSDGYILISWNNNFVLSKTTSFVLSVTEPIAWPVA